MKKHLLSFVSAVALFSATLITGCSKDDTTPPVVTLTGAASLEISLNSTFTDPGASATDDEDGTVSVSSDFSATNPNVNRVGTYTITYTATDAAGNTGTASRTIRVKNDAEGTIGTYGVNDVVPGATFSYTQQITVDSTVNNRVRFSRFGDYANNTGIYADKQSNGTFIIPLQSSGGPVGSGTGACDVVVHWFRSTNWTNLSTGFIFDYVDSVATPSTCAGSTTGTATYTR